MCIVIIKKKGVKFPSVANVKRSAEANPHGFAMAWFNGEENKLQTFRTLDKKEFMKKYDEVRKLDFKTSSLIIHARIKTHGTIKLENTHCWLDKETGISFAHNGILSVANRDDMTDSETFFRDIFLPVYKMTGWEGAEKAINAVIGTSKFAFIDTEGEIHHYGIYVKEKGCLYSNTSFQNRVYTPTHRVGFSNCTSYGKQVVYGEDYIFSWKNNAYLYRPCNISDKEWENIKKEHSYKGYKYYEDIEL